jgi:alkaline phosphatase
MGRAADDVNSPNPDILKGAREALEIISKGGSQFFMMIEGAYIDKDSHNNRYQNCVDSVKQYNDVIAYMSTFIFCHPDTALIVTADHETGNLVKDSSKEFGFRYSNNSSGASSTSETAYRQHTNNDVPVYALGPKTEYFNGYRVENVCIPHFAAQAFGDNNFGDPNYTKNRDKI